MHVKSFRTVREHARRSPLLRPKFQFSQHALVAPGKFAEDSTVALKMDCPPENFHAWNPNIAEFGSISRDDSASLDADRGKLFRKRCRSVIPHAERAGSAGLKTAPKVLVGFRHE
jgi:hypothetical protein